MYSGRIQRKYLGMTWLIASSTALKNRTAPVLKAARAKDTGLGHVKGQNDSNNSEESHIITQARWPIIRGARDPKLPELRMKESYFIIMMMKMVHIQRRSRCVTSEPEITEGSQEGTGKKATLLSVTCQRLANFTCREPNSQYLGICRPFSGSDLSSSTLLL